MNSIPNCRQKRFILSIFCLSLLLLFACAGQTDQSEVPLFDARRPVEVFASSQAEYQIELEMQAIDAYYTSFKVRTSNTVENCKDSLSGILHLADTITGNAEIREDDFKETIFAKSLINEDENCGFGVDRDIEGGYRVWLSVFDCAQNKRGCEFDAGAAVFYKQGERIGDKFVKGFLPASQIRLLTEADLSPFSDWGILRNEIFARHGHPFQTERYKWLFGERTHWYRPGENPVSAEILSEIEHKNVLFLQNLEKEGYSGFNGFLATLLGALAENDQSSMAKLIAPHLFDDLEIVFPEEAIQAFQLNEYRLRWNPESKQRELIIGKESGAQLQYYFNKRFDSSGKGQWILSQMFAVG
ncbi:MAG: YARHG domain-containing protein [Bacteroidota bacterium]